MSRMYRSAPIPFVGQKRVFARRFAQLVATLPGDSVFVDLFGGSGLLSHIAKRVHPEARVVYNDYDGYRGRLEALPRTNAILARIRRIVDGIPRHTQLPPLVKARVVELLETEERENGPLDYITLSSSLMFSMKYRTDLPSLSREAFYNNVRNEPYALCPDYLDGLEIVSSDYRELFRKCKDVPGVVFFVDPPYLSTEVGTYRMSWGLSDYLDVLEVLRGHRFVYFTSAKSSIMELCEWMGRHPSIGNPFEGCKRFDFNARLNYSASYTDIMLHNVDTPPGAA